MLPTMHRSTTARVHQQVHALMEGSQLHPFGRPLMVDSDPVCLPKFSDTTCLSTLHLELHYGDGSDVGNSTGRESGPLDSTESIFGHDGDSQVTEATTFDDNVDVRPGLFPVHGLRYDTPDQGLPDVRPHEESYGCLPNITPNVHFSGQTFGDLKIVSTAPGSIQAGIHSDRLGNQPEQSNGPARHHHHLGINDETPGAGADKVFGTTSAGLMIAAHSNTGITGAKPPPTEANLKTSPSRSDAALQARMNQSEGKIFRMMPPEGEIHFDVDLESFRSADVNQATTDRIEQAARIVDREFRRHDLGIAFSYAPGRDHKAFRICYDPSITGNTLAVAFFPSSPREDWKVRISRKALLPRTDGGYIECMRNILAHEFMHILGFRHWNAGVDANEMELPSLLVPDTADRDSASIMYTYVYDGLWFNEEDYKAIRRVYRESDGQVGGHLIVDVDPYGRS